MKTYTNEQLMDILQSHREWTLHKEGGVRANLSGGDLEDVVLPDDTNLYRADLTVANLTDADLSNINLSFSTLMGANLTRANLCGTNLRGANLRGANLSYANLMDADLTDANLTNGTDLTNGADLTGADLSRADLTNADLSNVNLTGTDLSCANLSYANLAGTNLSSANLTGIKEDIFGILDLAPKEVPALLDALKKGKVNGTVYEGECCCLVGTLAKARNCGYREIEGIIPDSTRPAECWFMAINEGNTPENHPVAKITAEWIQEWLDLNPASVQ